MATQGQQRAALIAAVREARRVYRAGDTAGEKVERELDRLIKRKTLISPRSLITLGNTINDYVGQVNGVVIIFNKLADAVMRNQPDIDILPTNVVR